MNPRACMPGLRIDCKRWAWAYLVLSRVQYDFQQCGVTRLLTLWWIRSRLDALASLGSKQLLQIAGTMGLAIRTPKHPLVQSVVQGMSLFIRKPYPAQALNLPLQSNQHRLHEHRQPDNSRQQHSRQHHYWSSFRPSAAWNSTPLRSAAGRLRCGGFWQSRSCLTTQSPTSQTVVSLYIYANKYLYTHTNVCMCIYIYVCIYIYSMYIYIYTYKHAHAHTQIYIYIYMVPPPCTHAFVLESQSSGGVGPWDSLVPKPFS